MKRTRFMILLGQGLVIAGVIAVAVIVAMACIPGDRMQTLVVTNWEMFGLWKAICVISAIEKIIGGIILVVAVAFGGAFIVVGVKKIILVPVSNNSTEKKQNLISRRSVKSHHHASSRASSIKTMPTPKKVESEKAQSNSVPPTHYSVDEILVSLEDENEIEIV